MPGIGESLSYQQEPTTAVCEKERISLKRYEELHKLAIVICEHVESVGLKRHEVCFFGGLCNQILNR